MSGLPVTVRLLDPPLHEFLPKSKKEISLVADALKITEKEIENRIQDLHEEKSNAWSQRMPISYLFSRDL